MTSLDLLYNRLLHGDCRDILPRMPEASIDLIVADPPYLVNYRARDGRSYPNDDNSDWVAPAYAAMYRVLKPHRFCISFYGWPKADLFLAAWRAAGFRPVSHFVWTKGYTSRTGYTQGRHECAYLLAKGQPRPPATPPPDVLPWRYSGNTLHPAQKPVASLKPLVTAYSQPGEIVLDPFAGSASTCVAARELGRSFIGIEQDARYHRIARERLAGLDARNAA